MDKCKKLLDVFDDYLSSNTYYEIFWSRLHEQYFAMSLDDEPAVFFENYEELRLYIVREFLYDMMFSGEFPGEYKNNRVSYKLIMAYKGRMRPYIEKLPELESVVERVIEEKGNI